MADKDIIILTGIKETLEALEKFDSDAVRRFNHVINSELAGAERDSRASINSIVNKKSNTPMSGWRTHDAFTPTQTRGGAGWPGWDTNLIKSKITKTKAEGKVKRGKASYLRYTTSAGALLNESASGSIFEIAGRRSDGAGTGQSFISTLNSRFGTASRSIWRTVDRDRVRIEFNVNRALNQAKEELQKHLNRKQA